MATVFVLSPANLSGVRGGRILESRAEAPFMSALRTGGAVPLGDVYAFISSLYYRGKRSYGRAFVGVDRANPAYVEPLRRTARALDRDLDGRGRIVLLGSIASDKYIEPLAEVFGERLFFTRAFVGRGDMSRGGLMLRSVESEEELEYVRASGAERKGRRPPKLGA